MGQALTSLTVSNRFLILLHIWSNWQIWSDLDCNPRKPPLAPNSVSYSVQAQLHHEQLPGWLCTRVLDWALPLRKWHSTKVNLRSSSQVQFLDIGRNAPVAEVSSSPHHSYEIYFLPTSDFSTSNINSSERDLKLTICNSPRFATEVLCYQCDLYYYYYY